MTQVQPEQQRQVDAEAIKAISALSTLYWNLRMFPEGHGQIEKSLDVAHETICRILASESPLTVATAKNGIIVGERRLDSRNSEAREFASALDRHDIAAVSFHKPLGKEDLRRFIRFVSGAPTGRFVNAPGPQSPSSAFPSIRLQYLDFSSLNLTEEKDIARPGTVSGLKRENLLWDDFISHLTTGGLSAEGRTASNLSSALSNPARLAQSLNAPGSDRSAAVRSFERVIREHASTSIGKRSSPAKDKDLDELETSLNVFLKELNPQLRRELLLVAFRNASSNEPAAEAGNLFGLSEGLIEEMMNEAKTEGLAISPSLLRLTESFSKSRASVEPLPSAPDMVEQQSGMETPATVGELQEFLKREKFEQYVVPEYSEMLAGLTYAPQTAQAREQEGFRLEDHILTLEDGYLILHISRAVLLLMDEGGPAEDYVNYSRWLAGNIPQLLDNGEFSFLSEALATFERHSKETYGPGIREAAGRRLEEFRSESTIRKALRVFGSRLNVKVDEAVRFLVSLGPGIVSKSIDFYGDMDEHADGERFIELLGHFREIAISDAFVRLHSGGAMSGSLRRMVMLIGRLGGLGSAPDLEPLLDHNDRSVRMETLEVLLKLKNPRATALLCECLRSKIPSVSREAVRMAASCMVREIAPDLASMIRRLMWRRSHFEWNEELVRALGKIGDPCALPAIEKIVRARFSLRRKSLLRLKTVVFEYLDRYPFDSLTGILNLGLELPDERIRSMCNRIVQAGKPQ